MNYSLGTHTYKTALVTVRFRNKAEIPSLPTKNQPITPHKSITLLHHLFINSYNPPILFKISDTRTHVRFN
ncbi:MAG: hypothetical protein CL843_01940 [Crocinitomicaceae bacterium]|nr:hypothetical protein [Crocinitomicaceae bacterium]